MSEEKKDEMTIMSGDVGSVEDILGSGIKAKKGPRTCWTCGTEMVPDEAEEYLICPNQDKHPEGRPKGIVKVKLPDSEYP